MIVKLYIYHFVFSVCQLGVNLVNRSLDARSALLVSCYLPSLCTGFQCCVDVPDLNMSFNAYLSVDPCNYMLTVGIEKFTFNKSLDHYTFGKFYIKCLKRHWIFNNIYNSFLIGQENQYLHIKIM